MSADKRLVEALGDMTRYQILKLIKEEGPMSVSDMSVKLNKHRATIDKHVKQLMKAGLLVRKEDPERGVFVYMLTDAAINVIEGIEKAKESVPKPIIEMPVKKIRRIKIKKILPILKVLLVYGPSSFFIALGIIGFFIPEPDVRFLGRFTWLMLMLILALVWNILIRRMSEGSRKS